MSDVTKEYLEAMFKGVFDRLDKIDRGHEDMVSKMEKQRELIGDNDTAIKILEGRLVSGNKKFEYLEKDIEALQAQPYLSDEQIESIKKVPGMAVREKILWGAFTGVTGLVLTYVIGRFLGLL